MCLCGLRQRELAIDDRMQLTLAGQLDHAVELLRRRVRRATADDPRALADQRPQVDRDDRFVERARNDHPAARGERSHTPLESLAADRVEDDIGSELREPRAVVGERLSAELAQAVLLA